MDWSKAIIDVIDVRSFSSLWYWIAIAVLWSTMSHWVLGVPFDLINRARRKGGEAEQDLVDMTRVNVNRLLAVFTTSGTWLIGIVSFIVSSLLVLAIYYQFEFAQAILFIIVPSCVVGALCYWSAKRIEQKAEDMDTLYHYLMAHRLWTQVIGMISIFLTALFGMYHNLYAPPF